MFTTSDAIFSFIASVYGSGVPGGGRTAPVDTLRGSDTRRKKNLWANLQRIVEKRGRTGKKGVG